MQFLYLLYKKMSTKINSRASVCPSLGIAKKASVFGKAGDCISIMVNKQALHECLNLYRFSLFAYVILSKGYSPWRLDKLKQKLSTISKLSN